MVSQGHPAAQGIFRKKYVVFSYVPFCSVVTLQGKNISLQSKISLEMSMEC